MSGPRRGRQGGTARPSSHCLGRTWVFEADGHSEKRGCSLAILMPGIPPRPIQPAPDKLRRQPLSRGENRTCLGDLVGADVAVRQYEAWLNHLGLVIERARFPTNALGIAL